MSDQHLQTRLGLLLSWREKARRLEKECEESRKRGEMEPKRYDALCGFYISQARTADTHLQQLRLTGGKQLEEQAAGLRAALRRQAELLDQANQNKISIDEANRENRQIQRAIDQHRAAIVRFNKLLTAESATELGGMVELPLEQYAEKLHLQPEKAHQATGYKLTLRQRLGLNYTRENKWIAGVAGLLVIAGVLAVLYMMLWRVSIVFSISPLDANGHVRVTCTNGTLKPILLHAPWTDEIATGRHLTEVGAQGSTMDAYGIKTYVRLKDAADFRLMTSTSAAWTYNGQFTITMDAVEIAPKLSAEVELNTRQLRSLEPGIEELRLDCLRPGGQVVASFNVSLT